MKRLEKFIIKHASLVLQYQVYIFLMNGQVEQILNGGILQYWYPRKYLKTSV